MKNITNRIKVLIVVALAAISLTAANIAVLAAQPKSTGDSLQTSLLSKSVGTDADGLSDEAVYVFTQADGSVKNIIVSDWLKENGSDIYEKYVSEDKPPVEMHITYKLDDKEISPDELAGKSGKVTIRFDYENKAVYGNVHVPFIVLTGMLLDNEVFTDVEVTNGRLINDGSRQIVAGLAVPGIAEDLGIDKENFEIPEHIEISATVNNFEQGMTLSLVTSGLLEDFDPDSDDPLNELEESLDKIKDAVSQLLDGSWQLTEGLNTLLEKSETLSDGADALADGAAQVKSGAGQLADGASGVSDGADQLSNGLNELTANNAALNSGAEQVFNVLLSTAQSQIEQSGQSIPTLTIGNYASVLTDLINSLDDDGIYAQALAKVTAGVDAMGDSIYKQYVENNAESIYMVYLDGIADSLYQSYIDSIADTVYSQYIESISSDILSQYVLSQIPDEQKQAITEDELVQVVAASVSALTEEQAAQIKAAALEGLSDEQKGQILSGALANLTDEQKSQIRNGAYEALTDEQKEQILAGALQELTDEQKAQIRQGAIDLTMASDEVQAQIAAAKSDVQALSRLKAQLDTYNQFYAGLSVYTAGVSSAANGASQLASGSAQLSSGAADLYAGADELYNGLAQLQGSMPELIEGITSLRDGSYQITEGISTFNEEAVGKLESLEEEDLRGLMDKLSELKEAAEEYADIHYIYRTDEIHSN